MSLEQRLGSRKVKYRGWTDPEQAVANMMDALCNDIPELEKLLEEPQENKKEAARLIRKRIEDEGGHIPNYLRAIGAYSVRTKKYCPIFDGNQYNAIVMPLKEFEFDPVIDLGAPYKGWNNPEQAVANVRHALYHDIPRLQELSVHIQEKGVTKKLRRKYKQEAARLIRKRIQEEGNIINYSRAIRTKSVETPKVCPVFNGSIYYAITISLSEFGFEPVIDLGERYKYWNKPEQAVANMRHALFHDIPKLEELAKEPQRYKQEAARLIRERIQEEGHIGHYFNAIGVFSASSQKVCPVFGGSKYDAIAKSLSEFGFDHVIDLGAMPSLEEKISILLSQIPQDITLQGARKILKRESQTRSYSLRMGVTNFLITFVPEFQQQYIELRKQAGNTNQRNNYLVEFLAIPSTPAFKVINSADALNAIKLAVGESGTYLSQGDYFRFVQQVFGDGQFLGTESNEISDYLARGDFTDVSITEEAVDKSSRNPNYRIRMFLATNRNLKADETLDSFVKFYPSELEKDRNVEVALNNYLSMYAGIASVGHARVAKLGKKLVMKKDDEGYTYTLQTASVVANHQKSSCAYALITPFVNIETLEEYLKDKPEDKAEILASAMKAVLGLHTKGVENLGKLQEMPERTVLEEKLGTSDNLKIKDYHKDSHLLFVEGSELDYVYNQQLGISAILEESARIYPSLVHGDLHPRNCVVGKKGKVLFVDFEDEYTHVGAPQIDLAKLFSYKSMHLTMEQQLELVKGYAEMRGITDVEQFIMGYHAAAIYKILTHTRYVADNVVHIYTEKEASDKIKKDMDTIKAHAEKIFTAEQTNTLLEAVNSEFNMAQRYDKAA